MPQPLLNALRASQGRVFCRFPSKTVNLAVLGSFFASGRVRAPRPDRLERR